MIFHDSGGFNVNNLKKHVAGNLFLKNRPHRIITSYVHIYETLFYSVNLFDYQYYCT